MADESIKALCVENIYIYIYILGCRIIYERFILLKRKPFDLQYSVFWFFNVDFWFLWICIWLKWNIKWTKLGIFDTICFLHLIEMLRLCIEKEWCLKLLPTVGFRASKIEFLTSNTDRTAFSLRHYDWQWKMKLYINMKQRKVWLSPDKKATSRVEQDLSSSKDHVVCNVRLGRHN